MWVILGASSAIARAFARVAAEAGETMLLCGRDAGDLAATAADAAARGGLAEIIVMDAADGAALLARVGRDTGPLHVAVFLGAMPAQAAIDADPALIDAVIAANLTQPAALLHALAPLIEARGGGVIGTGSVAGDRGRRGNYAYGAAKAGFHAYLSGLRNRLGRHGAHVMTLKPGFVDTAMTWGLPGLFLVATPDAVARQAWRAYGRRRDVVYAPAFWGMILLVIRLIPERVFKKLSV